MANVSFKEGDIVLAPFRFFESEQKKARPCLVWKITPVSVTLVYITSQHPVAAFPTETALHLTDAARIGLTKASLVDFSKVDAACLPCDIRKVFGNLANLSRSKIRECYFAADAAGLFGKT